MLVILYVVGALACALAVYYTVKKLAPDLVLLGAAAVVSASWIIAAVVYGLGALASGGPHEAVTFWGYIATGITLPIAGIYVALIERTRWGSLALAAICLTSVFLAYRLPQIWPGGFAS